jgi:hypothetical protein
MDTETLDGSTNTDTLDDSLWQARLSLYGFSQREANTLQLAETCINAWKDRYAIKSQQQLRFL